MNRTAVLDSLKRPVVIGAVALGVIIVLVWLITFYVPQGHKLSSIHSEQQTLQQAVAQDEAKVRHLEDVSRHLPQITALYDTLRAYAPTTESMYTYIQTLSMAASSSGVSISSISPGSVSTVAGTSYSETPVTVIVDGSYDHLLAYIKTIYGLARLTDINGLTIAGGGPTATRQSSLNVTLSLEIFTASTSSQTSTQGSPNASSQSSSQSSSTNGTG